MRIRYDILLLVAFLWLTGCGPNAERDNPLDPVNGRGVDGIVYNIRGETVPDVMVVATPGNIVSRTNSLGQFSLVLDAGKQYILRASQADYKTVTDTVIIPSEGRLKHNIILPGIARIASAKALWRSIHTLDEQLPIYLMPQCIARLPDGESILSRYYNIRCSIKGKAYPPDSSRKLDAETREYYWCILDNNDTLITEGDSLTFSIDSAGSITQPPTLVKAKEDLGWPDIIQPVKNATFSLPDTFRWNNVPFYVLVRIEVWNSSAVVWQREQYNIENIYCDAELDGGQYYTWKVINTDLDGNQAIVESVFYLP